ncbi:hypothetical protein BDQ17DRAFT_1436123 [Cyathus striatus]|nr:hypothetical protein BDQ17DRAFT_1436123 [Cyathus striatus]
MTTTDKNDHVTLHACIALSTPTEAQRPAHPYLPVASFNSLPMQHPNRHRRRHHHRASESPGRRPESHRFWVGALALNVVMDIQLFIELTAFKDDNQWRACEVDASYDGWHPVGYEYAFRTAEEMGTVPVRDDDVDYLNTFNTIFRGFALAACLRIPPENIDKSVEVAGDAKVIEEVCGPALSRPIDTKQDTST